MLCLFPINSSYRAPPKEDDYSEQYDEDFDTTVTSHSKTHLTSDSSSSLTLTNDTTRQTNKDHIINKSELTQSTANPTLLNESGSSSSSSHSQKRLLDRSNTHRSFSDHLTEESGFNPSPIPLHHTPDISGRINSDKENLSGSAHSCLDDYDRRLSLTPIHPKGLASGREKMHTVPVKRTLVNNVSLSPLHKTEKPEVDISTSQLRKQPSSSSSFSPVRESLLNTQLHLSSTKQFVANSPQHVLVPSLQQENRDTLSSSESYEQNEDKLLDSNACIDAQPRDQSVLLNDSMLTEFNELQDALKAAGLPQIAEKPLPPENEESQLNVTSPTAIAGGKMSLTLQDRESTPDSVITAVQKLATVDQDLETVQTLRTENNTLEKAKEPSATRTEHTSMPLETQLRENAAKGCSPVPSILSRPIHQPFIEPHPEQATDTGASKKSMLREALRAIASEELTSVSRGIMYEHSRTRSGAHEKNGEFDRPNRTVHGGTHTVEVSVSQRTDNKLIPSKVSPISDHKKLETSPLSEKAPKQTIHVPTGSLESSSKLMDELADILNSTDDYQPSSSEPTSHTHELRSRQSQKPPEHNHPSKKLPDNNRGPNKRPFQVSSRLYPGPKAPPKTLTTKQGGARTQKSSPGIPPPRKFKRVSRQKSPPVKIVANRSPPGDVVTTQSPPVEIIANRRDGVCSRCAVENEETERWKKAWQEEKVSSSVRVR